MALVPALVVLAIGLLLVGWLLISWHDDHFRPRVPQDSDEVRDFPHAED